MKAAILAIGSLYWRETREQWRSQRLLAQQTQAVSAPIRYGRLSKSGTYTMVFDEAAKGRGLLILCQRPIKSFADLVEEAEALWKAESPTAEAHTISADWGTVAVHFTEHTKLTKALAADWEKHFEAHGEHVSPVTANGILDLRWGKRPDLNQPDPIVILATANRADDIPPSSIEVAERWLRQRDGHEQYFFRNILNGIRTSDDLDIWRHISTSPRRQEFETKFPDAIKVLAAAQKSRSA